MITANTNKEEHMAKILAVDDDTNLLRMVVVILEAQRHEVHYAANGQKALEALEGTAHDATLMITDMMMPPGMTGLELARTIRQGHQHPQLKILALTAMNRDLVEAGLNEKVFDEGLPKPFEPEELIAAVKRLTQPTADLA